MRKKVKVTVTGDQGSGKTSLIDGLKVVLNQLDYKVENNTATSEFNEIEFVEAQETELVEADLLEDNQPNQKELAEAIALLAYSSVQKLQVQNIANEIASHINKLKISETVPTPESKALAVITILENAAKLTKSKADDKLIAILKQVYTLVTGTSPVLEWFENIAQRIRTKRKAKRQARRVNRLENKA